MCPPDRFAQNSSDRRRVAHASPRLRTSNPRGGRIRYVHQRKRDTWRVGIAGSSTKIMIPFGLRWPWLHNNEEDSGNCFYVSGIARGEGHNGPRGCIPARPFNGGDGGGRKDAWRRMHGGAEGKERGEEEGVCVSTWQRKRALCVIG